MALFSSISAVPRSVSLSLHLPSRNLRRFSLPIASLSSSSSSPESSPSESIASSTKPFVEPAKLPNSSFNYALANPNGNPVTRIFQSTESAIERVIFDFRFLALLAVGGSLAGSLLCFLNEVYEQQKELILLGERVVLATLGFDLNVNHPYKPLVEAIKKFKVAQNALAQVAWNFVNDGLRTSLCLQFKPHHIAAGAIFLAAKFLKVKLPSDGEKVWWQEFDVTPRQLEEVSNQMLELYEQNRVLPSQGSEAEGSTGAGVCLPAPSKAPVAGEEPVSANGYTQAGGASTVKPGALVPSSSRQSSELPYANNQIGHQRSTQNRNNDYVSVISEHKVDDESKDRWHHEQDLPYGRENAGEASNRSKFGSERLAEDEEINDERNETTEAGEWKNDGASYKSGSVSGRNLEYREGPISQSPQDAIKRLDKDKVKAALEKQRKSRGDMPRRTDFMDEDDLIERELEDGVELAAEDEKIKRERRHSWSKHSNRPEADNPNRRKDEEDIGAGNYTGIMEGKSTQGLDVENVEEGEVSLYSDAEQGFRSPKSSGRKRKAGSPPNKQSEVKQRHDFTQGYPHSHHDIMDGGNRTGGRHGYAERDHKRHIQENHSHG